MSAVTEIRTVAFFYLYASSTTEDSSMKRYLVFPFLFIFLAASLNACSFFSSEKKRQEKTAAELFEQGRKAFGKGKHKDSIEAFQQLKNWYPFSQYVPEASLAIADSHYALKEYPEASAAYMEFERLHPSNPEAPRAAFRLGMCHYQQINTTDRDQIPTRQAITAFSHVVDTYPLSPYSSDARSKIAECRETLALSELSVARYYYKTKCYVAAQKRLESFLVEYSDTSRLASAQALLEQTNAAIEGKKPAPAIAIEEKKPFWKRIF